MTDGNLQQAVIDELDWEPSVNAADIGVTTKEGVVTLRGRVATYAEKLAAEKAAGRVTGVKAVAEELEVHWLFDPPDDGDIAQAAIQALSWDVEVPKDGVTVKVEKGLVTLAGTVDSHFQSRAAVKAVARLRGVRRVSNEIAIRPPVAASDVKSRIKAALSRHAQIDADKIDVTTEGGKVTLTGTVESWQERRVAEHTAWSAPGVERVDDRLTVA